MVGKVYKMPGVEEYQNSAGRGYGVRYFYDGEKSIRFNWRSVKLDSFALDSVDLWDGTSRDPKWNMSFDTKISLVKVLPTVVDFIKSPFGQGTFPIVTKFTDEELSEGLSLKEIQAMFENVLYEAQTKDDLFNAIVDSMKDGKPVDYSFGANGTPYKFFNAIKRVVPDFWVKDGQKWVFKGNPEDLRAKKDIIFSSLGIVTATVTSGGRNETYSPNEQVKEIESKGIQKVAYEEQLADLEILINMVVKGRSNALFVAGRGGCLSSDTEIDVYKIC